MPGSSVLLAKLGCMLSCPAIKKSFLLIQGGSYYKLDFPNTQGMNWLKKKNSEDGKKQAGGNKILPAQVPLMLWILFH